ncbi:hypothetical protein H5410_015084, partial [Solanum commersonii]
MSEESPRTMRVNMSKECSQSFSTSDEIDNWFSFHIHSAAREPYESCGASLHPPQSRGLPSDVLANHKSECGEYVKIALGELIVPFIESPNRLAILIKTIVWTFTLTEGSVKLGETGSASATNVVEWVRTGQLIMAK